MKTTRYIVLGLLMTLALNLSARMYEVGEQVYVNVLQSGVDGNDWSKDNAKLFLYFFQSTDNTKSVWVPLSPIESGSKVYVGTMPSNIEPWYDLVSVVRKSSTGTAGNWNDRWNQSCDINIPNNYNPDDNTGCDCNFLNEFYSKNNLDDNCVVDRDWKGYAPTASSLASAAAIAAGGVTMEQISICPNDLGGPFSLRVKLNSSKTDYVYSNVKGHGWYMSFNGTTWTEVTPGTTGTPLDGVDAEIDINKNQLPSTYTGGIMYYYLHSSIPSGRRLIQLNTNSTSCDLDCEITAFETAVSNVNADDNTYTLDGMVAFGQANGNLVISCEGKSITITAPKSPQAFSLQGVPAATTSGVTTTAIAYFVGDQTNCSKIITINVPNATEAVAVVNVDSLTGKSFTLTPKDYDPANTYVWLANGDTIKGAPQVLVINPYGKDSTTTYTYKEYYPASGSMDDIIENGDYEDATGYGTYKQQSTISDNDFWGIYNNSSSQMDFYDTCSLASDKKSNGFAVVRSAYNFYPTYAKVTAKSGNNFALFDAATGAAGANKKAWYATTATSSNLKLQNGTTYVLSFWAANINNYGEMDNAAKFKFYIEDISNPANPVKLDSSEVLDLSLAMYRNNLWHQCSKTYTAKADCNNVRISVVNLNTNTLNIGNDFALDDIQFHPISTVSKVVKSQQQFVVTSHEPKVDAFTATVVPLDCDAAPKYTVKMHVEYENPNGRLIIKDQTTNTEYPYTLPAVAFDTKTNLDEDIVINGLTPATHTWNVYFENWTTAQITGITTDAPVVPTIDTATVSFTEPGCTDLTTALSLDLKYTHQQGQMRYTITEMSGDSTASTTTSDSEQTLNTLLYAGIPADGKVRHLRVWFDGANSCDKTYTLPAAPFSPVITSVAVVAPATVLCNAADYSATVTITTPYDATGRNLKLFYEGKDTTFAATGTTTTVPLLLTTIDGTSMTIDAAYEATPACLTTSTAFVTPTFLGCSKLDTTICEGNTVNWMGGTYPTTPYIGTDTFTSGYDSLILTIKALPRITVGTVSMVCDSASEVRIPFTVSTGTPDTYDIAVDGVHYAGKVIGSDLVFSPTSMVAGDYTATLTVSETGLGCESTVTSSFTIALSGHLYSKWTDVLFVSNADGRFVSYQWFADGVAMPGETMQRLYDPKGLAGTTTLYQCRMNTTDGKTIYTCPQTFDDATPSRTQDTGSSAPIKKIYDTMGRPVNGTPARGIYIVVMEIDGEQVTSKMLIHD